MEIQIAQEAILMRKAFVLRAKFNYLRFIKLKFKGELIFTRVEKRINAKLLLDYALVTLKRIRN